MRDRRSRPISRGERPQKNRASGGERKAAPRHEALAGVLSAEVARGTHERLSPKKCAKRAKIHPSRARIFGACGESLGRNVRLKRRMGGSVRLKRRKPPAHLISGPFVAFDGFGGTLRLHPPIVR
jgi:hypothetical protein